MGSITRFNLGQLGKQYGLQHFVETGTGRGDSLAHADASGAFRLLYSCEMEPALAAAAAERFKDNSRVLVIQRRSDKFLRNVCVALDPDEPALFWLDAHFPGADYGMRGYAGEKDEAVRLPLHTELEIIRSRRPRGRDVILIDDLRIYADGPYRNGNVPQNVREALPANRSAEFIKTTLAATHDVQFLYDDEGYAALLPKAEK